MSSRFAVNENAWYQRDRDLELRLYVARTRWNLQQEAALIAEELRREGAKVTRELIEHRSLLAIMNAQPRSRLVAWGLSDEIVERIVARVAKDVAQELEPAP